MTRVRFLVNQEHTTSGAGNGAAFLQKYESQFGQRKKEL